MKDIDNTIRKTFNSMLNAVAKLPNDGMRLDALIGILKYGAYGKEIETEDDLVKEVFDEMVLDISNETERHKRCVYNGMKGGRPAAVSIEEILEMRQSGMTNKKIAEKAGCTVKNIGNRLYQYRKKCAEQERIDQERIKAQQKQEQLLEMKRSLDEKIAREKESRDRFLQEHAVPESKQFISGDGLPGKRVCDLSMKEAHEIIEKLSHGNADYRIEIEYGLRPGLLNNDFKKAWQAYVSEYAKMPRKQSS